MTLPFLKSLGLEVNREPSSRTGRRTKIIFTVGPASEDEAVLRSIINAGADICRINMAHASREWTREIIAKIHRLGEECERPIAVMMDVKGPEIRTGDLPAPLVLEPGESFSFFSEPGSGNGERGVSVNYPGLANDLKEGDTILVDNGLLRFQVTSICGHRIHCRVEIGGTMGNRRHINLPGVRIKLPALTAKDEEDLMAGIPEGLDFVALSFVRSAEDIDTLRSFLRNKGCPARIIAKIEDQQAISNLQDIIRNSDGLMVARGDLGIECPFEELPLIQRQAVSICLACGTPIIIATHMLESMITAPLPTRAEVTDVANAVMEQADAIMLSGETSVGRYPLASVEAFDKIARRIEGSGARNGLVSRLELKNDKAKIQHAAVVMANELQATALVVFTRYGNVPTGLAALRPLHSPIYAMTNDTGTLRRLRLHWGVEPHHMVFCTEPDATIQRALSILVGAGRLRRGDKVVVVSDILAANRVIDSIQLRTIE